VTRTAGSADLFARVDAIAPILEADIGSGDELRRLPDSTVTAIRGAGLLRLKVPAVLGGDEAEPDLQFDVFARVASSNVAAAWCLFIWADSVGAACARLCDEGVARLLAGGDVPVMSGGGGLRPGALRRVPGGYRLDGTFRYGSGIHAAEWVLLFGLAPDDGSSSGRPEVRGCIIARGDAELLDNWHVLGMRGTGSTDYVVHDAFVPEEMTYRAASVPSRGGRMYRTGLVGYLGYPVPAVTFGVARRVLDELTSTAATTSRGYGRPQVLATRGTFQNFLGEADQRLKAARALMIASGVGLMDAVDHDPGGLRAVEADVRAAGAYAVRVATDVVADAVRYAGGAAMRQGSIYERAVRDLTVAGSHLLVNESAYENHAQFMLGIPGADPMA
jgi:alkylation response protein AidB-like acyl-CoA dehydrogenase